MECIDTEVNITEILYLEVFEQIFSYLNHYELTTVRLVCKTFNHASSYEFGRKSRLVFNSINSSELNHFLQTSSFDFPIRHMRILNLKIYGSCCPFDCTNLKSLPAATINDLEVVECPGIDETILLQICARFTNMTTFSFINEIDDTKIDAAYLIGHLCGRLQSLTLKIRNVTEDLEVPVITTSAIESLTILQRQHDVLEFEKSKLFAVISAIAKGLKHISLDLLLTYRDMPGEYNDAVLFLSELEWNLLQSLELFLEPMEHSCYALTVWIKKIKHRLTELTLNGHLLHLIEFSIFDWVCDNCPQLTRLMFVCTGHDCYESCVEYEFDDKRLEKLKKLTHLKAFQAPSVLENAVKNPASIKTIQQLNSHLRHLEIALVFDVDDEIIDLGLIGHFRDLTNLKISIVYTVEPRDIPIGESIFMNQLFQNFTSLQVLSFELLRIDEIKYEVEDNHHGADVRNLKQLRSIEVSFGDKYICQWMSFELLAQMPGLQSITFIGYKDEIQLSAITRILQNCTHLTILHFTNCKWAEENEAIKSQIILALPYGRKCTVIVN